MTPLANLLRRAAVARIYDVEDRTVLLAPDGSGHALDGDSAALARAVLAFLAIPRAAADVRDHVEALAGAPLSRPAVVDELLHLLVRVGAVELGAPPEAAPRGPGPRVVLGLTGAIATMHAPLTVLRLQQRGFTVRVAATADALRFVRTEALEALTHHPVVHAIWSEGQVHIVPHIELAQWADAVLVAPASATTIARLAAGDYASVVSAIALATRAPVLVVPSMNPAMVESPAVQRNLARLAADGLHIAHPARGLEVADRPDARTPVFGASPPPEVVVQLLESVLRASPSGPPHTAAAWDRLYRTHPPADLPWQRDDPDPDLLAAVARAAPTPSAVLEVGAGLGAHAVALARLGHRVLATDLSTAALEHARARAPDAPVVWLQDDILATHLRTRFDLVLDRACLHVLTPTDAPRYAAALAELVRPAGTLLIKTFADTTSARSATPYTADQIAALFTPHFTLERSEDSTLPGPHDAPPARLFELRRA